MVIIMKENEEIQQISSISNKDEFITYTFIKKQSFFQFLFNLLKEFDISIPDYYGIDGKLPGINTWIDNYSFYSNEKTQIHTIFGQKKITLIIYPSNRKKLSEFVDKYARFIKNQ